VRASTRFEAATSRSAWSCPTPAGASPRARWTASSKFYYTTKEEGTGLAVDRPEIVVRHGGRIEVDSREGSVHVCGCTCRLHLPGSRPGDRR